MTLPEWLQGHFPTDHHRAVGWQPYVLHRPLQMQVLCVATTRLEGMWCAYCYAVPGRSHRAEQQLVLDRGDKLGEEVALAIFPEFVGVPYAR